MTDWKRINTYILCMLMALLAVACANDVKIDGLTGDEAKAQDEGGPNGGSEGRLGSDGVAGIDNTTDDPLVADDELSAAPESPPTAEPVIGELILESVRVEPQNATLALALPGQPATLPYKVFAKFADVVDELEVTQFAVFSLKDNHALGTFAAFKNVFSTNPTSPRGGTATLIATAIGTDGVSMSAETTINVELSAALADPRDHTATPQHAPPPDIDAIFDSARAVGIGALAPPDIVYPNDGTMLPPNLRRLELHFLPKAPEHELFEIRFAGPSSTIVYRMRCGAPVQQGCLFELDELGYSYLAESNRGHDVDVQLTATDAVGSSLAESPVVKITFAETDVTGALYYWTTSRLPGASRSTGIMRFDFGSAQADPEVFLIPNDTNNNCVGCHTLSRDGTKMVASLNGQAANGGLQVLVTDLSKPKTDPAFFASNGDTVNRLQFASFNPDATEFVGIYGDAPVPARNMLWFYDAATGTRDAAKSIQLDFEPDHPEWSPDGTMIAVSHVGIHKSSQRPLNCGIDLLRAQGAGWTQPQVIVPIAPGKNRYNPSFVADSSFFVYSESICPNGNSSHDACDADADPSATTWAVAPQPGASPIWLANAGSPGIRDNGAAQLGDTFARVSPIESKHRGGKVQWVTVASRRQLGLRQKNAQQLLWMFALDPAKVIAGQDGSYPAFFLPFQDLNTDNHIGQWTERIVSDVPPPQPPPAVAPPVPPPPPPPPPDLIPTIK